MVGLALLSAGVLAGCAARVPHALPSASEPMLPEATARRIVSAWQQEFGQWVAQAGSGDPAVLSELPALHSTYGLRPARITFTVLNVDAFVPDRDGFDVSGLLLGKHSNAAGTWYVFAVGIVARRGYRPSSIADIRVAVMSPRDATPLWKTSAADAHALHRYRQVAITALPLRFPADIDRFSMAPCLAGICVQEQRSGAQWTIPLEGATDRTARRRGVLFGPPAGHSDLNQDLHLAPRSGVGPDFQRRCIHHHCSG